MAELLASIAPDLIVGAVCLLVGAAMGNYTAHRDNERTPREHAD